MVAVVRAMCPSLPRGSASLEWVQDDDALYVNMIKSTYYSWHPLAVYRAQCSTWVCCDADWTFDFGKGEKGEDLSNKDGPC